MKTVFLVWLLCIPAGAKTCIETHMNLGVTDRQMCWDTLKISNLANESRTAEGAISADCVYEEDRPTYEKTVPNKETNSHINTFVTVRSCFFDKRDPCLELGLITTDPLEKCQELAKEYTKTHTDTAGRKTLITCSIQDAAGPYALISCKSCGNKTVRNELSIPATTFPRLMELSEDVIHKSIDGALQELGRR